MPRWKLALGSGAFTALLGVICWFSGAAQRAEMARSAFYDDLLMGSGASVGMHGMQVAGIVFFVLAGMLLLAGLIGAVTERD